MAKDPSQMTDEELDAALEVAEPTTEEDEEPENPDEPKPTEESEEEEPEEPEEVEEEPKPKAKEEPSRREQLRVQQLLARHPNLAPPVPEAPADALDLEKELEADPEVIAKLKADRDKTNRAFYEQGIESAKTLQFHTRLEIDAPRVEAKYPQLDKNSEVFNPVLANAVNTMFLGQVGYNPGDTAKGIPERVADANLRYSDYVEAIFELADEIAGESTAATKKNIVKQAAKTGLRPDGSGSKKLNLNKLPGQMTDEELDAVIARGIPAR